MTSVSVVFVLGKSDPIPHELLHLLEDSECFLMLSLMLSLIVMILSLIEKLMYC